MGDAVCSIVHRTKIMAVYITANGISAARLLADIKAAIANNTVRTWDFDPNTGFKHITSNGQWNQGGHLKVVSSSDPQKLILFCHYLPNSTITTGTYGVLNGRFAEMVVNHFKGPYTGIIIKDLRS
ncbi:MAG: hypothetical protein ACRYG7_08660 [Janthinobacterium lividum]